MNKEQMILEIEDLKNKFYSLTNILKQTLDRETLRKPIRGDFGLVVVEKALSDLGAF